MTEHTFKSFLQLCMHMGGSVNEHMHPTLILDPFVWR